jgi:phage/plasmid-like protein (TIGR03299 family)
MAHEFTSGLFTRGQSAWYPLGTVIDGTCSAREAFRLAHADWSVNSVLIYDANLSPIDGYQLLTRSDNGGRLAVHADSYKIIQNEELIKVAEAFEHHATMSAVCVLRDGARVTFSMEVTDAIADVLPGDAVRAYLVGITSHDGKVAFQILFSPVRVVCNNTMSQAIGLADRGDASHRIKIRHTLNAADVIRQIPQIIDVQRRQFTGGIQELRAMAAKPCSLADFRRYVSAVFADQLAGTINQERGNPASARPKQLEDLPLWELVSGKFEGRAIGADIPGFRGTYWGAYQSITEFLTHDAGRSKDRAKAAADRFESLYWGPSAATLTRAHTVARAATRA